MEVQIKKGERPLFVELTRTEKQEQNDRMLAALKSKSKLEGEKKATAERFKADITFQDGIISEAVSLIDKGRMQDVAVDEHFDYDHNTVTVFRNDTGEEIEKRPMTKDERQMNLL